VIDAYAVLGVAPDATAEQLKAAHRRLVRRHHPDLAAPAAREAATRRVQDINVAYGLVRDPARRAEYDRLRAGGDDGAWDAAVTAAGRWAGRWWRRNRLLILGRAARIKAAGGRGGTAARRAGADALGRVLWLVLCAVGGLAGWVLATGAQRLAGVDGVLTPLVATLGGLALGNQRGWHLRLRLAGVNVAPGMVRIATAVYLVACAGALWIELAVR